MAKITACTPRTAAAAGGLAAETRSASTKTAVVTHAANLGPRTSTRSRCTVVLLLGTVLLLKNSRCAEKGRHATVGLRKPLRARAGARLLSSYSNNNNPRCGTDLLRDA